MPAELIGRWAFSHNMLVVSWAAKAERADSRPIPPGLPGTPAAAIAGSNTVASDWGLSSSDVGGPVPDKRRAILLLATAMPRASSMLRSQTGVRSNVSGLIGGTVGISGAWHA